MCGGVLGEGEKGSDNCVFTNKSFLNTIGIGDSGITCLLIQCVLIVEICKLVGMM